MDTPGYREPAPALAAGGKRALIWDRPNCGASDVCFDATSEVAAGGRVGEVRELAEARAAAARVHQLGGERCRRQWSTG
jgi:hypothetical protein